MSLRSYWRSTRRPRIARCACSSPTPTLQELLRVGLGRAEPVDRRDARHDDHVAPGQQRRGGRVAQPVDLVVDRAVLLDVGVGRREVRLGLVVVVVGDEVLDPVLREQLPELAGELRGEALVGREHDRGPLHLGDHRRDRERLPRPGDAEQGLVLLPRLDPLAERRDRLGLVAGGFEFGDEFQCGHRLRLYDEGGTGIPRTQPPFSAGSVRSSARHGGAHDPGRERGSARRSGVGEGGVAGDEVGPDRRRPGARAWPRSPSLWTTQVATARRSSSVAWAAMRASASARSTPRPSSRSSRSSRGASTTITQW